MATFSSCTVRTSGTRNKLRKIDGGNKADCSFDLSYPVSAPHGSKYHVFLSFRGEETRNNFTSFIYHGLTDAGFCVYLDNVELGASEDILPNLMEAIEESMLSMPIFSTGYASSKSCLDEVAKIAECKRTMGQIVLPIFYNIEPSDVRNQTGPFAESFREHQEKGVESLVLNKWRNALKEIGFLKGYTVRGDQAKLVKEIVSEVMQLLRTTEVPIDNNLVGIEQRMHAVLEILQVFCSDVRIVGICGMPGIGKSTLAQAVYNKVHLLFDSCSYIPSIRERSGEKELCSLQNLLISQLLNRKFKRFDSIEENIKFIRLRFINTRVLIVLDDVECLYHIEAFGVDCRCFGPGSRIILTTRKPELLVEAKVPLSLRYTVKALDELHAFKLFHWHAFEEDTAEREYHRLSAEIASSTGGIPLVIKLAGSYLSNYRNTDPKRWEEVLHQLRNCDYEQQEKLLKISYDSLTECQQKIYLDIACLLIGESNSIAFYMWHDCGFYPIQGIEKLLQMSLLKIGENDELLMSNPVREFGRKLVEKESTRRPEMQSRLWNHREGLRVLKRKMGTEKVEAMCLQFDSGTSQCLIKEEFDSLFELRFLRLDRAKMSGDFTNLLPKLRWLDWKNCPQDSEELENLYLEKLVILDMSHSNVTQNWRVWELIMKNVEKLKAVVLTNCDTFCGSPFFPDHLQLERLNFEHCSQLRRISIPSGTIKSLVHLNVKCCPNLDELPHGLSSMTALKELIIDGTSVREFNGGRMKNLEVLSACNCKDLRIIDSSIGDLKSLLVLALDDAAVEELPDSIGKLTKLRTLSLRNCRNLHTLPTTVGDLASLVRMDLSHTAIDEFPYKGLESLKVLLMEKTFLGEFPKAIANLRSLEKVDFSHCRRMTGGIPDEINNLSSLTTLMLSGANISGLPTSISGLSQLQVLDLLKCKKFQDLPILPTSLTSLHIGSYNMWSIPDLSYMTNLMELHLADNTGEHLELSTEETVSKSWPDNTFQWIKSLSKLETLELSISKILMLPLNLSSLLKLKKLVLSCPYLKCLPQLPSGLMTLHLRYCKSLKKEENFSYLTCLSDLELDNCDVEVINLENLSQLQLLKISDCCGLREIIGIQGLSSLIKFTFANCPGFQRPDLSILEMEGLEVEEW